VRALEHDLDLRPRYKHIDALKYDVVVCGNCGFGAVSRYFVPTSPSQSKWIREQITSSFTPFEEPAPTYSYEDSIRLHKLALMSSVVKHARPSEKAYCCLKLAWLYRAQAENAEDEPVKASYREKEHEFIQKAYEGFIEAEANERFPMCGMDEMTVNYLIASLAWEVGEDRTALRYLSDVITSKTAPSRTKDYARRLKDMIKDEELQEAD
jgi:uncharacterized protein (DUF2225 family)